jgi:hypothetical protein
VSNVEEIEVKVSLSMGLYSVGSVFLKSRDDDLLDIEASEGEEGVNFEVMAWLML